MLVPHVGSEIVRPLDPVSSDVHAPFNRTIDTVIVVHCPVVPGEGLLCFEGSRPRATRSLTGKFTRGTSMRATAAVMSTC